MIQVAVEIVDGCEVTFVETIQVPRKGPAQYPNTYQGVITKTIIFCGRKLYNIKVPNIDNEFHIPYWTIIRFTFGGVWMPNHKFDIQRLDKLIKKMMSRK